MFAKDENFVISDGIFQQIEIVDTSGDDQFPVMRDLNIRTGNAFVVVYSVDNMGTFYEAQNFCNLISSIKGEKKVPVVMVGNKTDLTDSWEVPTDVAFRAAAIDLNCSYIETSAKCNINVENAFQVLLPNYKDPSTFENDSESQKGGFKKRFRRHNSLNLLKINSTVKKCSSVDYGTAQCNAQCTIL